jgi:hypothetical protein
LGISHTSAQNTKPSEPEIIGGNVGISGVDCETTKAILDGIAQDASENQSIIIIARLGRGEISKRLNLQRLRILRGYLKNTRGLPESRIVIAEGERVSGLGQVEMYIGGKLTTIFTMKRNKDFARGCSTA